MALEHAAQPITRAPRAERQPEQPTEEERASHDLTHLLQELCGHCVSSRSRRIIKLAADKSLHQARENLPLLDHQPATNLKPIAKTSDTCLFKKWLCILADNWIKQLRPPQSQECLRTILGGKARATLDKRARRAASMVAYARSRRCQLFPLSDVVVIPYLTNLKSEEKRSAILDTADMMQMATKDAMTALFVVDKSTGVCRAIPLPSKGEVIGSWS